MTPQARAVTTRHAVLTAAAEVFNKRGYAAATISEILASAAVTKGALYFHFPSKEALAKEVMRAQSKWLGERPPSKEGAIQALIDLSYAFAHALLENPLIRASIRLTVEQGTFSDPNPAAYGDWANTIRVLLLRAKDEGDLHPGLDAERAAEIIVGAVTGIQLTSEVFSSGSDLPRRMTDMWILILPGLVPARTLARVSVRDTAGAR
jgi:AcrR family transcriptional regulator